MKLIPLIICILVTLSGCAGTNKVNNLQAPASPRQAVYYKAILNWQDRLSEKSFQNFDFPQLITMQQKIEENGWNNTTVDEIIEEVRMLTYLTMETEDHWDTPKEFVEKNFQGDCEDIAIFLLAMLKKLNYPYPVRIFAIKSDFVEHAVLKVQMPDNRWKIFETVKRTENTMKFVYTPIVEFNDQEIIFSAI